MIQYEPLNDYHHYSLLSFRVAIIQLLLPDVFGIPSIFAVLSNFPANQIKAVGYKLRIIIRLINYSYLNDSTGFLEATFKDCQKIVIKAIHMEIIPDEAKIHHDNSVLYAK